MTKISVKQTLGDSGYIILCYGIDKLQNFIRITFLIKKQIFSILWQVFAKNDSLLLFE